MIRIEKGKGKKMRRIRKLKKSIKGISPIISTLLLIAIAVVASLVVYLWVMGYLGSKTSTAGDSIMIPSFTSTNGYLTVYVQNTGQGIVHLTQSGSVYANTTMAQITLENGTASKPSYAIPTGLTVGVVTNYPAVQNDQVTIKVVTAEGTFIQVSGTVQGAAPATSISVASTTGTSQTAGTQFSVTVTAKYASGSVDTAYTGTVHFTSTDAQAGLPANYQFTAGDAGVHTFSVTLKTAGTQSVTVTDTSNKISGSQSISVSPGAAVSVSVSPSTDTVTAGATVPYAATAKDTYGNTLPPTTTATWGPPSAGSWNGATLSATLTTQVQGTFTITATVGSASGTAQLTVNSGSAVSFTVSGFPSPVTAGATGNSVTVTAKDQQGNVATGYTGTVKITSSDGQAVLPANYQFTTADAGVHAFPVTLKTAGTQTITATDTVTSSITGTQTGIAVNPASGASFSVSGFPNPTTAGTAGTVTVTALDQYGNVATGYTGTVQITSSDPQAVLPANAGLTNGVGTFSVTLKTAGTQTITATDTVTSSMTGSQTGIGVNPSSAVTFGFSSVGAQAAGTSFTVTITAKDAYGNTATSYAGAAMLTDLNGPISPASATFAAGVWTGPVTVTGAMAEDALIATDSVSSSIAGESGLFTVNPGPLASFTFGSINSPQTAGTAFSVTITAVDQYGNIETGYAGPATLTDTSGSVYTTAPGTTTTGAFANGAWTGSVTVTKATTSDVITATDSATKMAGSSQSFTVNSLATPSGFSFSTIASPQTAGTAFSVTITAVDQYGNTVPGYTGTAKLTDTSASISPTSATFAAGVWTGSVTVTKATTSDVITATDSTNDLTGSSSPFAVGPGALASFTFGTISSPQVAGTSFTVTVTAFDKYGNVEANYAGPATLTDISGSISPTSTGAFTAGVWTGSVTVTKTNTADVITATDASSGMTGSSNSFAVNSAALASFTISTIPNPVTAGKSFSVTISAFDQYGNLLTSYSGATLSDLSGSGSLSPTTTGAFTAGAWTGSLTLTKAYTNDVITVTDSASGINVKSNQFNVVAGSIDHFVFNTIGQQTAGTAFTVTITAEDSSGNTVTNYAGSAGFTDLSGTITLKSTGVFTNGVLQASVAITKAYTSDVITATDTSTGATGKSNTFNVVAAPPTQLVYTAGTSQSITTSTVSSVITVQLEDASGNPATETSSVTVNLATSTTTGTFWSNSGGTTKITSVTIAAGLSTASFYYSDTAAGSPVLTASSTGLTSATTTFTISADKLVFIEGATQTLATGQTSTAIMIAQETPTGGSDYNIFSTTTIQLTTTSAGGEFVSTPGGSKITSVTVGALSYESSTFYYVDSVVGTPTLTASAGGFTPGTTMFTIYAPTLSSFKITATSYNVAVGTSFSITITAIDQQGNTMTSYTGTNTLSASLGAISPTSTGAFTNGVWTGSVSLNTAGSVTISTSGGGATGTSSTFTVYTPTLTSFSFSTIGSPKTAGTTFSITITAKDQYGNTLTSYGGTAALTETGGGAGGTVSPASVTFTNGVYTGNVYVTKSGSSVTITATSGSVSTASGSTFTVNMGTPVSITVSPATDTVTAGNTVTYTATGTDAYGNTGSETTSVTWSISSGAGGSWNNNVYTSATAGTWTVTATYSTSVKGTASLTVNAGSLAQYVFGTISSPQTSGVAFTVTITQEDASGNIVTTQGATPVLEVSRGTVTSTNWTFSNGVWTGQVTVTQTPARTVYLYVNGYQNNNNSNTFTA